MGAGRFFIGSLAEAILWAISLGLAGYFLGKIPAVAHNIELIAVAIVVISVVQIVVGVLRRRIRARRKQRPEGEPVGHLHGDRPAPDGEDVLIALNAYWKRSFFSRPNGPRCCCC